LRSQAQGEGAVAGAIPTFGLTASADLDTVEPQPFSGRDETMVNNRTAILMRRPRDLVRAIACGEAVPVNRMS
jgi:hypothetical protein